MGDPVNNPSHYNKGGIETIDYMRTRCTPEEFKGYLRLNVIKYIDRAPDKGKELQDYQKAEWYLKELISTVTAKIPEPNPGTDANPSKSI